MKIEKTDIKFLALLISAFLIAGIFINPFAEFPLNDDWLYTLSVQNLLNNGYYHASDYSNAVFLAQAYWGAIWCKFFGFSFSILRLSTLFLAFTGAVYFYFIVKEHSQNSGISVILTFLYFFNPLFLCLSRKLLC